MTANSGKRLSAGFSFTSPPAIGSLREGGHLNLLGAFIRDPQQAILAYRGASDSTRFRAGFGLVGGCREVRGRASSGDADVADRPTLSECRNGGKARQSRWVKALASLSMSYSFGK